MMRTFMNGATSLAKATTEGHSQPLAAGNAAAISPLTGMRPRVLMITHRTPYPPDKGDRIRTYQLLRFMAERAAVDLASLADEPVDKETEAVLCRLAEQVELVPVNSYTRWVRAALSLGRGRSATEGLFASRELIRIVDRWCEANSYDLIVVVCSSMAQFLPKHTNGQMTKLIDLIDVDSQKWFDYASKSFGLKRAFYQLEGRRVRALESKLQRRFDHVALTTLDEVECFREFCPDGDVLVLPNGVDYDYYHPNYDVVEAPNTCVFVGALDYRPNVEGVEWFCNVVWPQIVKSRPAARFAIVGRRPVESVCRLAGRTGIQVIADVADVRPHLWNAAVVVAPLQIARGVQNKVLEAMASGKAALVSPEALTGLTAKDGQELCVARSAAQWQSMLQQLFDDGVKRSRLGASARRHVVQHHRWDNCLLPLATIVNERATRG
jgi:polysaccharide biosynthesis protein PslH